jgi:hypothetical protein
MVRGSAMGTSATRPDLHTAPGFNIDLCRSIRSAVRGATPVVLQGSVVEAEQAQRALDDGVADAPLALRHGKAVAPVKVSMWSAMSWAAMALLVR